MTLAPCRTCGQDVAPSARTCPHCGQRGPTRDPNERPEWLTLLFALVFAGVAISIVAAVLQ